MLLITVTVSLWAGTIARTGKTVIMLAASISVYIFLQIMECTLYYQVSQKTNNQIVSP